MSKLIMIKGLPGSGKTSLANLYRRGDPNKVVVTKDDLRQSLFGDAKRQGWHEKIVLYARDQIIVRTLISGRSVISADCNLNPIHEEKLREIARNLKVTFEVIDLTHVSLDQCIKQDLMRDRSVGEKVIRRMHDQYIRPTLTVTQDPQLPFAVICDLDGTLALLNGRNPYDASGCEYDKLNEPVWNCVRKYLDDGYQLIISSGRSSEFLAQTNRWLEKHGIAPDLFMMRKEGDDRKDYEVKREMYLQNIHDKYYVEVVFDDRNQVVTAWRDLGLTCFQVADGWF